VCFVLCEFFELVSLLECRGSWGVADVQSHIQSLIAAAVKGESSESKFFSVTLICRPWGIRLNGNVMNFHSRRGFLIKSFEFVRALLLQLWVTFVYGLFVSWLLFVVIVRSVASGCGS